MAPRNTGRIRRLILTAVIAAGVGGSVAGVALASTGGSAATTTVRTQSATTPSASKTPPGGSSSAPSGRPASGSVTGHHCTNMKGSKSSTPA
jgi:hypothetical protein